MLISGKSTAKTVQEFNTLDHIQTTLATRAAMIVKQVVTMIKESKEHKKIYENELYQIDISRMTRIHLVYIIFKLARARIESAKTSDQNCKKYLEIAIKVFALKQLTIDHQSLYECGYFGFGSGKLLDQAYRSLLIELRPQMVSLVECFPEHCRFIPTTIGNEYGDIYEMQFETARASKLNHAIVPKFYQTHMKPVMNMRKVQVPKL